MMNIRYILIFVLLFCFDLKSGRGENQPDDGFQPVFPFVISYDHPDNITSFSHLLDAPAGKNGFIRVKDGHFQTDKGPIRFHATNITGPANFPSHENADKIAERFARLGINCCRLHFMDTWYLNFMEHETQGILDDASKTQRNLSDSQLDKLDYMIAAFKKRGIYVNLNLHVGRTLDQRDGFPVSSWANKGFGQFVPKMIDLQKEYAAKLLTHVNHYTGNAYTDESAIAMIEITNEDSFQHGWFSGEYARAPELYQKELKRLWNKWLATKYKSADELKAAWKRETNDLPLTDEQIHEGNFDNPNAVKNFRILAPGKASIKIEDGVLKYIVTKKGGDFCPKLVRDLSVKANQVYTISFTIRRTDSNNKSNWSLSSALAMESPERGWVSLGYRNLTPVGGQKVKISHTFIASETTQKAFLQLTRFDPGIYEIDDLSFCSGGKILGPDPNKFDGGDIECFNPNAISPGKALDDFGQFLEDTEKSYWLTMYHYIKNELKAKQPISGTQYDYSAEHIQGLLDYTDAHGYWRHPSGNQTSLIEALAGREKWQLRNDSMINSLFNVMSLARHRVHGKPYTISEYNHPYPNQFGAEGQPYLAIFGALQNWDGIFQYSYNHFVDSWEPQGNPWCIFDSIARTDVLAHLPACSAAFMRRDVAPAKVFYRFPVDRKMYSCNRLIQRNIANNLGNLPLAFAAVHGMALDISSNTITPENMPKIDANAKIIKSDTGEITWNREINEKAYLAVNTVNTKFFIGYPDNRTIDLGGIKLTVGRTRLNWTTISLVSRFGNGFGDQGKASILLTATGDCGNTDRVLKVLDESNKMITLAQRGHGPVWAEGIPATLLFQKVNEKIKCFALDSRGDRKEELPVKKTSAGTEITIDPKYKTVWYEIEFE